jgi:sulfatase modifying factor 1
LLKKRSEKGIINNTKMVFVEGGTFTMGDTFGDLLFEGSKPIHTVHLSDFHIGKYPVTQAFYKYVMGVSQSYFEGINNPEDDVSWFNAIEFCNKLSEIEGLEKCYSGTFDNVLCNFKSNGYRLPTEAEWEYAAKGGAKSKGLKFSGTNDSFSVGWYYCGESDDPAIHTIGYRKNELDIYDMSGNVWEWCWDWYGEYSPNTQTNPTGTATGKEKIIRGGCWGDFEDQYRCDNRGVSYPFLGNVNNGFRVVRSKI